MTWGDVVGFLKKGAPMLATAASATGPAGVLAYSVLEKVLNLAPGPNTEDDARRAAIIKALEADPEKIVEITKQEQDFKAKLIELGYTSQKDLAALTVQDRSDARKMLEVTHSTIPAIVTFISMGGGIAGLFFLVVHGPIAGMDPGLAGRIQATFEFMVINPPSFWLGGAYIAKHAQELLAQSSPNNGSAKVIEMKKTA